MKGCGQTKNNSKRGSIMDKILVNKDSSVASFVC